MNFVNGCENGVVNFKDADGDSGDESSAGWLSREVDSSEESSAESVYEDCYRAKNDWNGRNSVVHKAILDRAYNFIRDEVFSSETTTGSESGVENYPPKNNRALLNPVAGDGEEIFLSLKKRRSEECTRAKRGGNLKSRSSPKISAKKMQNFEERRWTKKAEKHPESFFSNSLPSCRRSRNTARFQLAESCTRSVSDSSDILSEGSSPEEAIGNLGGKFSWKKKSKKNPDFRTTGIRRRRKSPSTEFQGRLNRLQEDFRRKYAEIYEAENSLARIAKSSNLRDRPNRQLISKMRKIYSEQILIEKLRRENNEALFSQVENWSSDDSLIIDVEEILQENLRGKNTRFTVESVLLEDNNGEDSNLVGFRKPGRRREQFSPEICTSDGNANEVKLLGDIKRRIDEDFAETLTGSSKSSEDGVRNSFNVGGKESSNVAVSSLESDHSGEDSPEEIITRERTCNGNVSRSRVAEKSETFHPTKTSSKSSRQYLVVDSIDSGVSTDFSRNDSDLSRRDRSLKTEIFAGSKAIQSPISPGDEKRHVGIVASSNRSEVEDEKVLDEEVEMAVRKFTEELIICERRALERGLTDEFRRGRTSAGRKREKPYRQVRYSSSSSPRSVNTFSTKTSRSSSEEEYLENISPPSLCCSVSDSDAENLSDFFHQT